MECKVRKRNEDRRNSDGDELCLDANVYKHPTNLLETEDSTSASSENLTPSDSNEQAQIVDNGNVNEDENDEKRNNTDNANTQSSNPLDKINSNRPRHILQKYAPTYELEEYSRNVLLIFNHEKFLCCDPRPGTMKDEEALTNTFTKFGFTVQPYPNLKRRELLDTVKEFAEQTDFSTYGCICVAILTHGGVTGPGHLQAWDTSYHEHELIELFNAHKNPTLAAKPIIFLIEACRGYYPAGTVDAGRPTSRDLEYDRGGDGQYYTIPTESDMLIFHSSYVGRASVRSKSNGTYFIQTLCSMIKKHAATCDLETIFRKVKMAVALDAAEWIEDPHKVPKQMPVVTSTLIREIHLRPYEPDKLEIQSKNEVDTSNLKLDSMKITGDCRNDHNHIEPTTDDTTVPSLPNMPCSCFLDYFVYLKKCLGLFISKNPQDPAARMLMAMAEKVGDGVETIYLKLTLTETIWDFLKTNTEKFPYDYVYRSCY